MYIFISFIVLTLALIYWVSSFFRKGPVNVFSDIKFLKDSLFHFFIFIWDTYISPFLLYLATLNKNHSINVINPIESTNVELSAKESQGSHSANTNLLEESFIEFQESFERRDSDFPEFLLQDVELIEIGSKREQEIIQSIMEDLLVYPYGRRKEHLEIQYPFYLSANLFLETYIKSILRKAVELLDEKDLFFIMVRIGTFNFEGDVEEESVFEDESGATLCLNIPMSIKKNIVDLKRFGYKIRHIEDPFVLSQILDFIRKNSQKYTVTHYNLSIIFSKAETRLWSQKIINYIQNGEKE